MKRTFVALCSPSTWWKTTLANMLKERDGFWSPEHFTTRGRRKWDQIESGYTHISEESFVHRIKDWSINIFTTFDFNLYGYSADSVQDAKTLFVIEPKGIAHLERYCTEKNIRLISIFIGVDDETRKKRFLKREGSLDNYFSRKNIDDYITKLWPKYCDNILYSSGGPERMYQKLRTIILDEENGVFLHKLKKLWRKISFQIKSTLLDTNT